MRASSWTSRDHKITRPDRAQPHRQALQGRGLSRSAASSTPSPPSTATPHGQVRRQRHVLTSSGAAGRRFLWDYGGWRGPASSGTLLVCGGRMSSFVDLTWRGEGGLALYARDYAPSAGPARCPVVCIHGLTRNCADFEEVAPWIAAKGRRVSPSTSAAAAARIAIRIRAATTPASMPGMCSGFSTMPASRAPSSSALPWAASSPWR